MLISRSARVATAGAFLLTYLFVAPAGASGCTIVGTPGPDILRGTPAADVICAGSGDDTVLGRGGNDVLRGGSGDDRVLGGPGGDDLLGAGGEDELLGGIGNDELLGNGLDDVLLGGDGDDVLTGGIGDDILEGGLGDDLLTGSDGLDFLDGGAGRDGCAEEDTEDTRQNCEDVTPPVLQSFSFEPSSVDTSGGAQTITIKAHITDDLSGLKDGYNETFYSYPTVWINGPEGSNVEVTAKFRPGPEDPESNLVEGSPRDGHYEATLELPAYSAPGTWHVRYISLVDEAENEVALFEQELIAAGHDTTFEQTGPGDSSAPEVTSLAFAPNSIDTSSTAKQIAITATIEDDASGVASAFLTFSTPDHRQYLHAALSSESSEGPFVGTLDVPRYAAQGTWTLDQISIKDRAGNYDAIQTPEMVERGFPTTFEQTGPGDTTPPQLVEFDFSPKQVNTSQSDQVITFTARVTDDLAGLIDAQMLFQAPGVGCSTAECTDNPQSLRVRFTAQDRISGDARDGVYRVEAVLPRYSQLGTWTLFWVSAWDEARNSLLMVEHHDDPTFMPGHRGEVSAKGMPVSFVNGS